MSLGQDNLLDPLTNPQTGALPADVMTFLRNKYRTAMEERNTEIRKTPLGKGEEHAQIDIEAELAKIQVFVNFCQDLLGKKTRPAEIFHAPDNFGIKLTSGESFVICTSLDIPRGSMQPSHSHPVTGVRDYAEAMGANGPAVPITKPPRQVPEGMEDRSVSTDTTVDRTEQQPARRFDQ